MGAELNAGTGKETTSVYARVLDDHLDRAFDVMADMVWRPRFDRRRPRRTSARSSSRRSRCTRTTRRTRSSTCSARPSSATHPLGRAIIGRAEVVGGATPARLRAFHAARYVPAQRRRRGRRLGRPRRARRAGPPRRRRAQRRDRARGARRAVAAGAAPSASSTKDTEQYHVCLGAPGHRPRRRAPLRAARARQHPRRHVVLAAVPGGAREARPGLHRLLASSRCTPAPARSACTSARGPDNVATGAGRRRRRARALPRGPRHAPTSSTRAKENVKGRVVLALESTAARMNRLGSSVLGGLPLLSVDEVEARIDAVTLDDVARAGRASCSRPSA